MPAARRSILLQGLRLTLAHPGALLWTYAANLGVALLFSLRTYNQFSDVLNHSLAGARLTSAFDLGTMVAASERITHSAASTGASSFAGVPVYLLLYFVLVPGALFSYANSTRSWLGNLLGSGLAFFWRFVRITLLTLLVSAVVLGPLIGLQALWSKHVEEVVSEGAAFWRLLPGRILILLVAALLRLFFDLVEVYTVQLAAQTQPNGSPDRRVRRTLLPAFRTLRMHFGRAYGMFLLLGALGAAALLLSGRVATHMLAQPRVWPMFLLAQCGLFLMLLTRFWQRGAETILAAETPLTWLRVEREIGSSTATAPPPAPAPAETAAAEPLAHYPDAQPDPEPAVPSLPEPDPGVFHHDPPAPQP